MVTRNSLPGESLLFNFGPFARAKPAPERKSERNPNNRPRFAAAEKPAVSIFRSRQLLDFSAAPALSLL